MLKQKVLSFLDSDKVHLISQLVLGGIFVYASLGKVLSPQDFMTTIRNYRILPEYLVGMAAYILPWMELIFGSLLMLNIYPRFSASILSVLLLIFIGAISSVLIRGINIECGCFLQRFNNKEFSVLDGFSLIIRDILFFLIGLILVFFKRPKKQVIHNNIATR